MPKLTQRQRVYFGVGKFGTSLFMQVVTIATVYIYGSAFQLDYKLNAIGNAVGKIFIAFSGFFFSYLSDILKNPKWGRRKFFVWTGTHDLPVRDLLLKLAKIEFSGPLVYELSFDETIQSMEFVKEKIPEVL